MISNKIMAVIKDGFCYRIKFKFKLKIIIIIKLLNLYRAVSIKIFNCKIFNCI